MSTHAPAGRTTSTSRTGGADRAPLPRHTVVGLSIAALLGAADLVSLAFLTPDGEIGPPLGILLLGAALGVITLVCVVVAWRTRSKGVIRIVAGARLLSALGAVPAFFAGPPPPLVVIASVTVILTVVCICLLLAPAARPTTLTD